MKMARQYCFRPTPTPFCEERRGKGTEKDSLPPDRRESGQSGENISEGGGSSGDLPRVDARPLTNAVRQERTCDGRTKRGITESITKK